MPVCIWVYSHTRLQYVGMFKSKRNTNTRLTKVSAMFLSYVTQWFTTVTDPAEGSKSRPNVPLWTLSYPGMDGTHAEPYRVASSGKIPVKLSVGIGGKK